MARPGQVEAWPDVLRNLASGADETGLVRAALAGARVLTGADLAIARVAVGGVPQVLGQQDDGPVDVALASHANPLDDADLLARALLAGDDAGAVLGLHLPERMRAWTLTRVTAPGPAGLGLGWLCALRRDAVPFTPEQVRTLNALAGQLGMALQNLRRGLHLDVSEARYRTLVEQLPAVTYFRAIDTPGIASFVSPQIEPMLGYTPAEWLANPTLWTERLHPEDRVRVQSDLAQRRDPEVLARAPISVEYRVYHRDGRLLWVRNHSLAVPGSDGKPAFVLGVIYDISTEKQREASLLQSQEELRLAQRMDAIGRLAGGVAHDFNNLLTAITAYCEMLLQALPQASAERADVEEIRKAADRAAALTQQLLAFSRRQQLAPKVLDLDVVLREMGKMLARLIGEDIDLMIRPDAQPGGVRADPTQLEQVLLNLCVNARDSMPDGGRLAVATEVVVPDEALLKRHAGMQPVPYVLLTIADTGMGMDAETQQHLFEPFFTTKPRGKGTGLGLATVYGIVKQSQGHVEVESEPGRGTTFRIYLPRVQMETPSLQPASQRTQARPGTEVVLLAEDEAMVRGLVLRVLRRYGYTVLEARDGQEAVDLAEQHEGHIDLLLTDVVMPRLSGPELARRVLPLRPGLKVLYMSGYVDRALGNRGRLDPDSAFLQKPFTPDQLAAKVREVLGSVGIDRA